MKQQCMIAETVAVGVQNLWGGFGLIHSHFLSL